jgi:hypothetical protein
MPLEPIEIGDQVKLIVSPFVSGKVGDIRNNVLILHCLGPEGTVYVDRVNVIKVREQREIRPSGIRHWE